MVQQFLPGDETPPESQGWARALNDSRPGQAHYPDLADVKGQAAAKRALEIAAAGGHSLLLAGSPGSGKSMLAQRFAGLLPAMSTQEALESAAIASLGGRFSIDRWAVRPTCAPHHTASAVALVGGGSPPRPGEISLAHHGVLFLDELPEFPRAALEALREPLETGAITRDHIIADYYDLGAFIRTSDDEITICKNGGGAHLDLMTSRYILDRWRAAE